MNRFVVTKGTLQGPRGAGVIVAGVDGSEVFYNRASWRTEVRYTENKGHANQAVVDETYYIEDGMVIATFQNNVRRAQRLYDAVGNTTDYWEIGTDGNTVTPRSAVSPAWTFARSARISAACASRTSRCSSMKVAAASVSTLTLYGGRTLFSSRSHSGCPAR